MYQKFDYKNSMPTPWGKADSINRICDGVIEVGTPSHGGILVGKNVAKKLLSQKAQSIGREWNQYLVYEEDCDWSAFVFEQSDLYSNAWTIKNPNMTAENPGKYTPKFWKEMARYTLEKWHQEYFQG